MLAPPVAEGRAYAIGAPDEGAEGPEPLDGPGGAVEVANRPHPHPVDDELPPEPLDNPRRLLVWPAPDVPTQQALSDRGYRPVIVNSREEVDAQIAAFPAALFVDPADRSHHPYRPAVAAPGGRRGRGPGAGHRRSRAGHPGSGVRR